MSRLTTAHHDIARALTRKAEQIAPEGAILVDGDVAPEHRAGDYRRVRVVAFDAAWIDVLIDRVGWTDLAKLRKVSVQVFPIASPDPERPHAMEVIVRRA